MKKLFLFLFSLLLIIGFSSATEYTISNPTTVTGSSSSSLGSNAFSCFLSNCVLVSVTLGNSDSCPNWYLADTGLSTFTLSNILASGSIVSRIATINYPLIKSKVYRLWIGSGAIPNGFTGSCPHTFYTVNNTLGYISTINGDGFSWNGIGITTATGLTVTLSERFHYASITYSGYDYTSNTYTYTDPSGTGTITSNITLTGSATFTAGYPNWIVDSVGGASNIYYNGTLMTGTTANIYLIGNSYSLTMSGTDLVFSIGGFARFILP